MSSKLRSICLFAVLSLAAACGNGSTTDSSAATPNETTASNNTGATPAVPKPSANGDVVPSVEEPPFMPPSLEPEAPTAPPAQEPPAANPPAEPPPAANPPAEPPPAAPPAEPPMTEEPPVQMPPTPPTTPPAVDAGTPATPPADPNAGWVAVPNSTRRLTFPQGQTGPGTTGAASIIPVTGATRYRIKYEVMPEGNFDFRAGGKLPGMGGGTAPTGGSQDTSGWSGRLMWNYGGRISFYFYRVTGGVGGNDTGGYGTHWYWDADATLIAGQWNTIELLVDLTTGETVGYLNGVEKGRQTLHYLWPTADKVVYSAFFGGQGAQYEPSKTEYMSFRNMMIKPGG